jgi:hypothetical protein
VFTATRNYLVSMFFLFICYFNSCLSLTVSDCNFYIDYISVNLFYYWCKYGFFYLFSVICVSDAFSI